MISRKNTVPLSATASSHAIAATAPARTPPRRAALTVFAARSLRLGLDPISRSRSAAELMSPRYRSSTRFQLWLAPESEEAQPPVAVGSEDVGLAAELVDLDAPVVRAARFDERADLLEPLVVVRQ